MSHTQTAPSQDVVRVTGLVKRYRELVALDHLDLSVRKGEIFGLLGPNGSGKTTAINCILQLLSYDRGTIELFGEPMAPNRYDLKARVGVVPQQVAVFDELTVRENVDAFCALYVRDRRRRRQLVDEAIDFVGLGDYARFRPAKLSGGLARRLNIACGMVWRDGSTSPAASPTARSSSSSTSPPSPLTRRAARTSWTASAACATRAPRWSTRATTWRRSSRSAVAS